MEASDLFLFIASVAVSVIALTIILVGYQIAKAIQEVRNLARLAQTEVTALTRGVKNFSLDSRFFGKWIGLLLQRIIRRRF